MLNKLAIFLVLSVSLNANALLTHYRTTGQVLVKEIDAGLTNVNYWNKHLEKTDTSFGYLEAYTSVLFCDKSAATLKLYSHNEKKQFSSLNDYSAFTGEIDGDKQVEGDLKTPHGVYELTQKKDDVDSFYGPLAFVTSYPNTYDKYRGKTGHGIWIHGLPTKQKRDDFTRGCIAINNDNITSLDTKINIYNTLLIISPKPLEKQISKEVYAHILASLYTWRYSWIYNDIKQYLSFYSSDFKRHDGMKYDDFTKYKTRIFNKQEEKKIVFNNINVVPYPNTPNVFKITFKEFYTSSSYKFTGNKVLMIKVDANKNFKIFTEK